jgi:transcriptional regulator with XRE-family HTH domain
MNVAAVTRSARIRAGLSLRHLAERAGTSHATLSAYETGRVSPSVQTFQRIIRAAGFDMAIDLVPLVGSDELNPGDELAQVLDLASQFPSRHSRDLLYPIFGPR